MKPAPWVRHAPFLSTLLVIWNLMPGCEKRERPPGKTTDSAVGDSATETGHTGGPDSEDTGETEDTVETEDSERVTFLHVDEIAYMTVYGEEHESLGGPVMLGDVSGDGIDDFCMENDFGGECAGWASPLEPGVFTSKVADFFLAEDYGWRVGTPGDINNDGIADVLRGDGIFLGPLSGRLTSADADVRFVYREDFNDISTQQGHWGDSDGDGVMEVILNIWNRKREDRLLLFDNIEGATVDVEDRTAEIAISTSPELSYNDTFCFAGDLNGDGLDDVTYLHGNCIAYGPLPDWSEGWEYCVGSPHAEPAGDQNQDGYDDLIGEGSEELRVYNGPIEGHIEAKYASATILVMDAPRLRSIDSGSAGDVDSDGFPDLMFTFGSRMRVFFSPLEGTLPDTEADGKFNLSGGGVNLIDGQTDLSGDGVPELVVGDTVGEDLTNKGVGWVILGGSWF